MKRISIFLFTALMIMAVAGMSYAVTITLQAPTTNTDGSALTDLASVKVYCGYATGSNWSFDKKVAYTTPGGSATIDLPVPVEEGKKIYCVGTAFDTSGNESAVSGEVTHTFPTVAPSPPVVQSIQ
jgi:hypothetical protein